MSGVSIGYLDNCSAACTLGMALTASRLIPKKDLRPGIRSLSSIPQARQVSEGVSAAVLNSPQVVMSWHVRESTHCSCSPRSTSVFSPSLLIVLHRIRFSPSFGDSRRTIAKFHLRCTPSMASAVCNITNHIKFANTRYTTESHI